MLINLDSMAMIIALRVGVEVFPEVQFLGRSFRFGPKGELALHVFSPPLKG